MTGNAPSIRIGCAGWSIASAHGKYFPEDGSQLERYARVFNAVEINSSFYRPHRPQTYAKWSEATPGDFRFAVKMPKTISHQKRLQNCAEEVRAFLDQAGCLGSKLGILLLQLPPSFAFDSKVACAFFDGLHMHYQGPIACEPRHPSWFNASADAALRARHVARAAADPARVPRAAVPGGNHHVEYLRLHGSPRVYYDAYSDVTLARVTNRLIRRSVTTRERWCIFDNTAQGHAITDAVKLKAMIAEASPR